MAKRTTVINIRGYHGEPYVYIGRPGYWGNPFTHIPLGNTLAQFQCKTREESIEKYTEWFIDALATKKGFKEALEDLKGRALGCFCAPLACHGDIIAHYLNNDESDPVNE